MQELKEISRLTEYVAPVPAARRQMPLQIDFISGPQPGILVVSHCVIGYQIGGRHSKKKSQRQ